MRNTTLSQTWFGAKGDAWTPFVNALTDLGLGVEILLPKRLMDTGPARGGVYEHGWFCLGKPWEHESLLASRLAARLGAPVELIRCKAKATIRGRHLLRRGSGRRPPPARRLPRAPARAR